MAISVTDYSFLEAALSLFAQIIYIYLYTSSRRYSIGGSKFLTTMCFAVVQVTTDKGYDLWMRTLHVQFRNVT